MKQFLGPFRIAAISPSTLKIEDIFEVDFPIPEFQKAKLRWKTDLVGAKQEEPDEWVLGTVTYPPLSVYIFSLFFSPFLT